MGYIISAAGRNALLVGGKAEFQQSSKETFDGKFITVRDGDGNINLDFYYARARKARSEAAYSFFRNLFSICFRRND